MNGRPKITVRREVRGLGVDRSMDSVVKKAAEQAIRSECEDTRFEITVTYTDNSSIRELNSQFRNIDSATDVLSFPMLDFKDGVPTADFSDERDPDSGYLYLGDVVISAPRAREQAEEYGHSQEREFAFLTVHSVLHLLGYDHEQDDNGRLVMESKQKKVLDDLGIVR